MHRVLVDADRRVSLRPLGRCADARADRPFHSIARVNGTDHITVLHAFDESHADPVRQALLCPLVDDAGAPRSRSPQPDAEPT